MKRKQYAHHICPYCGFVGWNFQPREFERHVLSEHNAIVRAENHDQKVVTQLVNDMRINPQKYRNKGR